MEKISTSLMIELMGKPPEHISEALRTIVTKIDSTKGSKVINKIYHDPKLAEGSKTLYTAFVEVGVEFDELAHYFMTVFTYMPSHVEIVRPEKIDLTNADLNELTNALTQRLHNYDAVTKNAVMEKELLTKKLKEVAPHLFKDYDPKKPLPKQTAKKTKKKSAVTIPKKSTNAKKPKKKSR